MQKLLLTLVIASTLLLAPQVQAKLTMNTDQAIEFVAGVMDGVIQKDNLKEIKLCISDVKTISNEVQEIAQDIMTLEMPKMIEGVMKFMELLQQYKGSLTQCEAIRPDVERFMKFGEVFLHPADLINRVTTNLPAHLNEIMSDVQAAKHDLSLGNFFSAGENFGETIVLAIGQVQMTQ
eukprot:403350611